MFYLDVILCHQMTKRQSPTKQTKQVHKPIQIKLQNCSIVLIFMSQITRHKITKLIFLFVFSFELKFAKFFLCLAIKFSQAIYT